MDSTDRGIFFPSFSIASIRKSWIFEGVSENIVLIVSNIKKMAFDRALYTVLW